MTDEPKVISFKQLKRKKGLHLSDTLREVYEEGVQCLKSQIKKSNDPRFDPKVHGICKLKDWTSLGEERQNVVTKLRKRLGKEKSEAERAKIKQALHLLRQREATQRDVDFRRTEMKKLQEEQITELKAGKRVKFLRRAELRQQLCQKRLKKMSKKQRSKYLNRKEKHHSRLDNDLD